jgi:hypothetical protein
MTIKNGGPAFPTHEDMQEGMTLRDHFAGLAMAAIIAIPTDEDPDEDPDDRAVVAAYYAYKYADAMLRSREANAMRKAREAKPETCKPALQVERADARRGRWLLDKMRHQNYGPNSGWTLTDIYPGDDAAAAIDAAMAKERGDD